MRIQVLLQQENALRQSDRWPLRRRKTRKGMPMLEAYRKIHALVRWEVKIDSMLKRSKGACCPSCLFGSPYQDALDKVRRSSN
jgi:hypothetical protein